MILSYHQLVFMGPLGEAYAPNERNVARTSGSFEAGACRECLACGVSGHPGSHASANHYPWDE